LALIRSIKSLSVFAGTAGWVEMTLGEAATSVMGAKSLIGSNGSLAYMLGLTMKPVLTTRIV